MHEKSHQRYKTCQKAYDNGCPKVAEVDKVLQDHANLLKNKEALERQLKALEDKLAEMKGALEASVNAAKEVETTKEGVRVVLEIEVAVREAVSLYQSSEEFTILLDNEVSLEMMDLIYRFKRFNPGQKLNLNFVADPPLLPEGLTKEMIEEYEGPAESGPEVEPNAEGRDVLGTVDAEA